MSFATYTLGSPTHPTIHHDNGFLDRFSPRTATTEDRLRLARWMATLEAAEAAQGVPLVPHNDIPDALAAYRHFLFGNGADRYLSYERYVAGDQSGTKTLENAILDAQQGAQSLYLSNFAAMQNPTFSITGTAIACGDNKHRPEFPYPETENWQKAIGAHFIWMSGDVSVDTSTSPPRFTLKMTLHAEDKYNFNPGASDIATGIPDSDNGVFEVTGLAKQYMNYATLYREVKWTGYVGSAGGGSGNDVSRGPLRDRQPDDNRRVRNRW